MMSENTFVGRVWSWGLAVGLGTVVVLASGLSGCLTSGASDEAYSVSVLGDMHYDAAPPEKYHAKKLASCAKNGNLQPPCLKEFTRNAKMWEDICKRILASASAVRRPDAAFALQLGDLVQGDCEDGALHTQMLAEATGLLEGAFPNLPIVSLCGNHDIRGDGARAAYERYMIPYTTRQLAGLAPNGVGSTTYGFRRGKDLWIVLDFNRGPRHADIVRKLLADNPDVRYTFVVTHGPVLPMELWRKSRWFYLGEAKHDALRREMRALFAKRNAIVLAGHVHSLELKDWYGDGGRITEMVLNTCAGKGDGTYFPAEPKVVSEDPATYGSWGEPELFGEYRPGIRRYFTSHAVGHYVLRVSDAGVRLDYYGHDARTPTREFVLR